MKVVNQALKAWNRMSLLQKAFLVVALLTVVCSICTDCVLCNHWPVKFPLGREGFQDAADPAAAANGADSQFKGPVVAGGKNGAPKIVLYYVPWCPHCKNIMPEWNKLEQNMQGTQTEVKKVDCEANPEAAKQNNVDGFPTIILFKNGKALNYEGDRTMEEIKSFIQNS